MKGLFPGLPKPSEEEGRGEEEEERKTQNSSLQKNAWLLGGIGGCEGWQRHISWPACLFCPPSRGVLRLAALRPLCSPPVLAAGRAMAFMHGAHRAALAWASST